MVSLSTVYGVSIVLASLSAMGAAFVGSKVYPIQSGGDPLAVAAGLGATITGALALAESKVKEAVAPGPEPLATETVKEEPVDIEPALKTQIAGAFDGNEEVAQLIIEFLKTPVKDWNTIATDLSDLNKKFRDSMTHPNMNKCPASILKICQLAAKKYSNMRDYIQTDSLNELGDQRQEAYTLLNEPTKEEEPLPESTA